MSNRYNVTVKDLFEEAKRTPPNFSRPIFEPPFSSPVTAKPKTNFEGHIAFHQQRDRMEVGYLGKRLRRGKKAKPKTINGIVVGSGVAMMLSKPTSAVSVRPITGTTNSTPAYPA